MFLLEGSARRLPEGGRGSGHPGFITTTCQEQGVESLVLALPKLNPCDKPKGRLLCTPIRLSSVKPKSGQCGEP